MDMDYDFSLVTKLLQDRIHDQLFKIARCYQVHIFLLIFKKLFIKKK